MKNLLIILSLALILSVSARSQMVRTDMLIPDIPGYKTLKCDFHIHTVFSDGNVWPSTRVEEAWLMGYDAISITDHIEYQPHKKYIPVNHNAGYEIAKPHGDRQDMIVIQGSEVTRVMPPGHLNAIFIKDATKIETERIHHMHGMESHSHNYLDSIDNNHQDYMLALEEANKQGGFVFWNHPGWDAQAPDGIKIYDVHLELIKKGWLKGIEVANWDSWYPEAFQWCLDHDLAMLSNSDIHDTEGIYELVTKVTRRPVTLVFAEEKSETGIRDALENARTVVWFNDLVIGKKEFLHPLFENSVSINGPFFTDNNETRYYNLKNNSDFLLRMTPEDEKVTIEVPARKTVIISVKEEIDERSYTISNFLIGPEKSLQVNLHFD